MTAIVYKNNWFSVVKEGAWHYLVEQNSNNGAVVLILEDNKEFIFVRSYRKAINKTVIELPRGYGEANEASLDAAIRESLEETGYQIHKENITKLGSVYPNSAILSSEIDIFFANVSKIDRVKGHDSEVKEVIKIGKESIKDLIINGEIKDSFSIAAISFYELRKQEL